MRDRTPTPYREFSPTSKWYNCSVLVHAPKYLICFGQAIKFFFNPILIGLFTESLFIILHFGEFQHRDAIYSSLCEFHNLVLPPMVQIVGLYAIFRQPRPTLQRCQDGSYKRLGTIYGMPSGDAFYSTVISYFFIKQAPVLAVLLVFAVCFSRTIVGYHSICQVSVGTILGIILCLIRSVVSREVFQKWNWITAVFLPLIIFFDKNVETVEKYDYDNLQIWVVVDFAYTAFDIIYCAPESMRIFPQFSDGERLAMAVSSVLFFHLLSNIMCMKGVSIVSVVKKMF